MKVWYLNGQLFLFTLFPEEQKEGKKKKYMILNK
jgi:hypothetical protein